MYFTFFEEKMINLAFLKVLKKIHSRLSKTNINWAVTGTLGFALQGIPIKPNDIDIQTDEAGAYKIEKLFSKFVVKKVTFSKAENIRSHLGELKIDGIKVEIMGDIQKRNTNGTWEPPVDLNQHKKMIEVEGMKVPVLSLEYEYQAYLKLGRKDKAGMLKKWLNSKNKS